MGALIMRPEVRAARQVVRAAQRAREPALFDGGVYVGEAGGAPFRAAMGHLPLRVDNDPSYNDFVGALAARSPHVPDLAAQVARLREALRLHVSDGHGVTVTDVLGIAADVSRLRDAALCGEGRVPLSLPPGARGKVRCWRDAGQLCCSARVKGPDGRARILTTCSPIGEHVREATGYAHEAGVDELESLSYLPTLALMVGGGRLLERLCEAAPHVRASSKFQRAVPAWGEITPGGAISWQGGESEIEDDR